MEIEFIYQKKRTEFGRQCLFSDKPTELIDSCPSNKKCLVNYILRDPVHREAQCSFVQAEHELNTTRAHFANTGINHSEGGWPKEVSIQDEESTKRYRRKIEKDDNFNPTMMQLCKSMEHCVLQNNAINIYQQYFSDCEPTPAAEKSSARTVNVYQDQCTTKRPITHISWSPDSGTKLAISHCNPKFQAPVPSGTTHSYIWEVENPNRPLYTLKPPIPLVTLEYNQKDPNALVSGLNNGQIAVWDVRRGSEPVDISLIDISHHDPVHDVLWINSKSGTEFFSASSDGQLKWWDTRKMTSLVENLVLDMVKPEEQNITRALGASCLEYETTIPTRFMVGTEHGYVVSGNRKGKSATEKLSAKYFAHLGPVLALQRNSAFVKNFLTIGDWTAKIWSEECRESPIMWTSYHKPLLTDGAWSPTRYSVFYTTRTDGILDVWDVLQQQKHACMGVKVCDEELGAIRAHEMGRLVAVGNAKGTVYLVEFSENLSVASKTDKMLLTAMFERESKREKILEAKNRELRLKMKTKSAHAMAEDDEEGGGGPHAIEAPVISERTLHAENMRIAEDEFNDIIREEMKLRHPELEEFQSPPPSPAAPPPSEPEPPGPAPAPPTTPAEKPGAKKDKKKK